MRRIDERYVELTRREKMKMIEDLEESLRNLEPHIGTAKFPHQAIEMLRETEYTDLVSMNFMWEKEGGVNAQRHGTVRPLNVRDINGVEEGYQINAQSIRRAVQRMAMIVRESPYDTTYFDIRTPDQPFPRRSYVRRERISIEQRLNALYSARNGIVEVDYIDL